MRVPIFKGNGVIEYQERGEPVLDSYNNVLVELFACGVCGTDLNILSVPPMHKAKEGIIIGHEGVGIVREVFARHKTDTKNSTDNSTVQVGDRVVIAPRLLCDKCKYCRMGLQNQCTNYSTVGTTRDGAFAPYISLPDTALYKISDAVHIDDAVFFEPLSCVVGAVSRVKFMAGSTVAIIGAGPMGALFALLYKSMGAGNIYIFDISKTRLSYYNKLGFSNTVHLDGNLSGTSAQKTQNILESIQADIAVDAVGNQMASAVSLLRRGGQAILFGLKSGQKQEIEQYKITRDDITLHGTFVGLNPFVDTIQILELGMLAPSVLISHRFSLDELAKGVALMRSAEGMKVIIDIAM